MTAAARLRITLSFGLILAGCAQVPQRAPASSDPSHHPSGPIGIEAEFEPSTQFLSKRLRLSLLKRFRSIPEHIKKSGAKTNTRGKVFKHAGRKIPGLAPSPDTVREARGMGLEIDPLVEWGTAERTGDLLEVHLRAKDRADEVARRITESLSKLDIHNPFLHFHVLGKALSPKTPEYKALSPESRFFESIRLIEFARRLELVSQMALLVHERNPLLDGEHASIMLTHDFMQLVRSALQVKYPGIKKLFTSLFGDRVSGLWRWDLSRKYFKNDEGWIGGEYIGDIRGNTEWFARMLGAAQSGLVTGETGLSPQELRAWLNGQSLNLNEVAAMPSAVDQVSTVCKAIEPFLPINEYALDSRGTHIELSVDRKLNDGKTVKSYEGYLLIRPWEDDIIVQNNPQVIEQVKKLREPSLQRIRNGEESVDVVADFLRETGLFDLFQRSLGIKPLQ